jgi:hypothetical protein
MESNLTDKELNFIRQLIKNDTNKPEISILARAVPFVNVLLGSALIIVSSVFFLNDPTDYHAKWILLPGALSGIVLLVIGLLLSKENALNTERKKIASILKKLVNEDLLKK